jgi:adenylate kinase family enzyme
MERVVIVGPGGSGKSTLALELGRRLGLPVIHLDREYWRPGWVAPPEDWWQDRVRELVAGPRWVMDGNYGGSMATRFARADTILFLDFPRWRYLPRVIRRRFQYRRGTRPDMADGCDERLDRAFLTWLWRYPRQSRPHTLAALAAAPSGVRVVTIRSPHQVERFLGSLDSPAGAVQAHARIP